MTTLIVIAALAAVVALAMMLVRSREESARLAEQMRATQAQMQQQQQLQLQAQQRLQAESQQAFAAVAQQLLEQQTTRLRQANDQRMDDLLTPLRQNIETLRGSIETYKTQQAGYATAMQQQIADLRDMNRAIAGEASELSRALKGDSKVQGDWGELMLKQILDASGLKEGVAYDVQVTRDDTGQVLRNDEGNALRPDVVLHMPNNGQLIVDSKVSITAYAAAMAAQGEAERQSAIAAHCASVRKHVEELGAKQYQKYVKNAADFVLMFIPNEPAYMMAMANDHELWEWAYAKHVVIVSPTHLLSVAKLVGQLWTQENQNRNAVNIAEEAGRMYDKIDGLLTDLKAAQKALSQAQVAYDKAFVKIDGRGGLISRANKLKEMGAKATKQLPNANED